MRESILISGLLTCLVAGGAAGGTDRFEALPLIFEPNEGQAQAGVRFLARGTAEMILIAADGVALAVEGDGGRTLLRLRFPGAERLEPEGAEPLPGRSHYLYGSDPAGWRMSVGHYARVRCGELWDGVGLEIYGNRRRLEYDFVVSPHSDPGKIRMRWEGARAIRLDGAGALIAETAAGPLRQQPPAAYQQAGGERHSVEAAYLLDDAGEIRVRLGRYDPELPLIIDPVVSFSTFVGGSGFDVANAVAADPFGSIYIAGTTHSADFPTTAGAHQAGFETGEWPGDAFVTKLDGAGTTVVFSTYMGGRRGDEATAIALDTGGNILVAGKTDSTNFPVTSNAYRTYYQSAGVYPDGFVAKLNPEGSALAYSTYIGGEHSDLIHGLAVDGNGNAYVAGATDSYLYPTTSGAFRTALCPNLGLSGFVTKLSNNGSALAYSTLLCGSSTDEVFGIAVDGRGSAYVTGRTRSVDFPVRGAAVQPVGGGTSEDAFLSKLDPSGSKLIYSTYLGGSANDGGTAVAVDAAGNAYVTGYTRSTDLPVTEGALQTSHGDNGFSEDAFVMAVNVAGGGLVYGTYLGGSGADRGNAIAIDDSQHAHVAGQTESADFPTTAARCQTGFGGGRDAFLTKLDADGSAVRYSLFLGGRADDSAAGVAIEPGGDAIVAGRTASSSFTSTENAFRSAYAGGYRGATDAFVARVEDGPAPEAPCVALNGVVNGASLLPGPVAPGEIISIFGEGLGPAEARVFVLEDGMIAKELAGTRVYFDGELAPVIATSVYQVNAIVPYSVAGKEQVFVRLEYDGRFTGNVRVGVAASSPAIFTLNSSGGGAGAILNQDYSVNGPGRRAARGSVIQIFATGEGETTPPGVDGKLALDAWPAPLAEVSVTIGGLPAAVWYAGAAPGLVAGVIQVNAQVPPEVRPGSAVPVLLHFGGTTSPLGVTLAIE